MARRHTIAPPAWRRLSLPDAPRRERRGAGLAALVAVLLGATLPAHAQPAAAGVPEARVVRTLTLKGDLGSGKERRSLSGIACATPPGARERACLLAGDENDLLWSVTLTDSHIRLRHRIRLAAARGAAELDLEAATFAAGADGGAYYLTGSHGAARGSGAFEATRYQVFRIAADPATGLPRTGPGVVRTEALAAIIAASPELARVACRPHIACERLDRDGLTIEGLAARDGALYFGLRNPAAEQAILIRVPAASLFPGPAPQAQILRVHLGAGAGVRDLVPVAGGFLILAGSGRSDDHLPVRRSTIHFWDGQSATTTALAQITSPGEAKPEAMLLVAESTAGRPYQVLVLADGIKDGAPTLYEVPAP
ncbi:hypothetical protein ACI7BZ_12655 [Xanthobacter sp. AM11]|uniref:hypothetical protein n=1 Tax=Xanthobacter sp. AM11 TaxID=3380643 RepID=UPI0039BF6A29